MPHILAVAWAGKRNNGNLVALALSFSSHNFPPAVAALSRLTGSCRTWYMQITCAPARLCERRQVILAWLPPPRPRVDARNPAARKVAAERASGRAGRKIRPVQ